MPTIYVRPKTLRRRLALVGMGGLLAAAVATMPAARADGVISDMEAAYIAAYHGAVCGVLDEYPTAAGVVGIMRGIQDDGLSADSAVDVINASVDGFCSRHWPLLVRIGREARGENTISQVVAS
jgi:hypothetical protein